MVGSYTRLFLEAEMSRWITREDTFSDYQIHISKPFWNERWLCWSDEDFTISVELLEILRPDLKLKGGLNKKGQKEIKKI